ncbi:MAG: amidohydrolase family protein [Chitinophagales bacterium]|nr:amidohydrolase family protein [Chitinophagales bacterium]
MKANSTFIKSFIFNVLLVIVTSSYGQDTAIYLMGGYAHLGNGKVIENTLICLEKGAITMVADATLIKINLQGKKVIDIYGKHVYPGIIAANTTIGLDEVEAVRATEDYYEVGEFHPSVRALIAFNTDSKVLPTLTTNGILVAQTTPQGGYISGSSSIMHLNGWNWEDAQLKADDGIHLWWPGKVAGSDGSFKDYEAAVSKIEKYMVDAKAYLTANMANMNLGFEAMKPIFSDVAKLYVHVNNAKEIIDMVAFCDKQDLKPIIYGGAEAYLVADLLKTHNIPVVLSNVHDLPPRPGADVDLPYKMPKILKEKGVLFGLSCEGFWQTRNLPFFAGTAAAYGLTKEEALQAITGDMAKILGIDATVGTLEQGKEATLFVSEGDVLNMKTSKILKIFMQGEEINPENFQTELYHKYQEKYGF